MGLDVPELDDTDYEELMDEAQKLLPAYSDAWTNYNPQDPGITILETLAWLTDSYVYQQNSVTDDHRRKYLALMGEGPRPPTAASAQLSLAQPTDETPLRIAAGTQLTVVDGSDAEKTFETDEGVVLSGAKIRSVVSRHGDTTTDQSYANETRGMFYRPLGGDPEPGDAVALGVDGDPFAGADTLSVTVDYHDEDLPAPATHGGEEPTFAPSVDLVWEYCTDYAAPEDAWEPFSVVRDSTDSFYGDGTVTLAAPTEWDPSAWGAGEHGRYGSSPGLIWIRCRVASAGYEIPPRFDAVRLGVVAASNRRTVEGEPLERVRGTDGPASITEQRYQFRYAPVVEADIEVDGDRWTEVRDFDASGPTDTHYVLDETAGEIRFGDGGGGAVPDPDQRVVARRYVAVDGADGNVPASATWRFKEDETSTDGVDLTSVSVTPLAGATGGTDSESVEAAFRRVRRDLGTPFRAVTDDDMADLARHTPGLRVGRAMVLMQEREGAPPGAPPEARVVVVPYAPESVRRPTPSEGFLSAVQTHLDEHRLLTDRVRVVAPSYVGISVSVEVQSGDWRPVTERDDDVESAIRAYLDPIHGFEGDGWPFGRTLYAEELAGVIEDVEWVEGVERLSVTAPGNARVDPDGNVRIGEAALFDLESLEVEVGATGTNGDGRA
jgi:predicted phage baseplate assembly protein